MSDGDGAWRECRRVTIRNQRGLHARAAAKFVDCAGQFDAVIEVAKRDLAVSGESIMGLMLLAAAPGTDLELRARGPQARAALDALSRLIEGRFDED